MWRAPKPTYTNDTTIKSKREHLREIDWYLCTSLEEIQQKSIYVLFIVWNNRQLPVFFLKVCMCVTESELHWDVQRREERDQNRYFSLSGSMRKCEGEEREREEEKMKERGRAVDSIREGNSTHYSAGPSDLKHCQACSVLKEDKTGGNKFGNKIISEFIRNPVWPPASQ